MDGLGSGPGRIAGLCVCFGLRKRREGRPCVRYVLGYRFCFSVYKFPRSDCWVADYGRSVDGAVAFVFVW